MVSGKRRAAYDAANNTFYASANSAYSAVIDALNQISLYDYPARNAAWKAYSEAILAASKIRDQAHADTSHAQSEAVTTVNANWYRALAALQKTNALDQSSATQEYESAVLAHDTYYHGVKIAATIALETALAEISRDTAKVEANAAKARDLLLAANARQEQLALEQAKSNLWVAQATAKKAAINSWNAAISTPWTAYQLAIASSELNYFEALRTATVSRMTSVNSAAQSRSETVIHAKNVAALARIDAKFTLEEGYINAKETFWSDYASSLGEAVGDALRSRKSIRDDIADATYTREIATADAGETHSLTMNDAQLAYATTTISANFTRCSSLHCCQCERHLHHREKQFVTRFSNRQYRCQRSMVDNLQLQMEPVCCWDELHLHCATQHHRRRQESILRNGGPVGSRLCDSHFHHRKDRIPRDFRSLLYLR